MTDPVKAKIIEMVPEIMELVAIGAPVRANKENIYSTRPITLADVLRAIRSIKDKYRLELGFYKNDLEMCDVGFSPNVSVSWNLTVDFDGQSDEVKAFVGKLLGV